jgi:hypothetical protein
MLRLVLIAIAACAPLSCADIYVATTGNDTTGNGQLATA